MAITGTNHPSSHVSIDRSLRGFWAGLAYIHITGSLSLHMPSYACHHPKAQGCFVLEVCLLLFVCFLFLPLLVFPLIPACPLPTNFFHHT
ncbi:hypothetical protein B0T10DRAFT_304515 [Thelonectria olida]|uniref:Transmembrane protein n=1 Tax=Thelonectria olida TaxID=1576542 RepID=A0A9P9AQD6_9HYPO|nr:hypothetical protein B0T10DRAFT_304515 [Thelonectria olida]